MLGCAVCTLLCVGSGEREREENRNINKKLSSTESGGGCVVLLSNWGERHAHGAFQCSSTQKHHQVSAQHSKQTMHMQATQVVRRGHGRTDLIVGGGRLCEHFA
jgi:hypothetical protein